jgi:hypothetical protein
VLEPCCLYVHVVGFMNIFVCLTLCMVHTVLKSVILCWLNSIIETVLVTEGCKYFP